MKSILYIGNKLDTPKSNISSITIIGSLLEKEGYQLKYASDKANKVIRMLDMIGSLLSNKSNIDYVLIDTYSTINFYYALIISQLCRFFNLKYIPILHGGNLEKRLKYSPKLCKIIFEKAHKLVSPSDFLKNTFISYGYSNIEYIPNTIEIKNYEFLKKDFEAPRLLWVRSFSKIYNPKLAVLILDNLVKKGYKAELCMVGPDTDGTLKEVKQLAKELNLNVNFTGKLSKIEWIELSRDYNIFINTTNYDNMPLSVIEAMALGLPIVSTNVGGMPYLIENGVDGLLVRPNNVYEMSNAVIEIVCNIELRENLIKNMRKNSVKFDWKNVRIKWKKLLS